MKDRKMRYVLTIIVTLAIIYIVPFVLYGASSILWELKPRTEAGPVQSLLSIYINSIFALSRYRNKVLNRFLSAGHSSIRLRRQGQRWVEKRESS
jgi:hypothetical protein